MTTIQKKDLLPRLKLDYYVLPNKKGFPNFMNRVFAPKAASMKKRVLHYWEGEEHKKKEAFKHQEFVSDYLNEMTPYKSLLLYFGLGSGKSFSSILISSGFDNRQTIVMLPKSLRSNYENDIKEFASPFFKLDNFNWVYLKLTLSGNKIHTKKDILTFNKLEKLGFPKELLIHYNNLTKISVIKTHKKEDVTKYKIWLVDPSKKSNYTTLSDSRKTKIRNQMKKLYDYKYNFIHYNAGAYTIPSILRLLDEYEDIKSDLFPEEQKDSFLSKTEPQLTFIKEMFNRGLNPFNGKTIVIDEVHNLMSNISGAGKIGFIVYELIMRAVDTRIIALSGTPVINYPYEIALLFNLLHGFIETFVFTIDIGEELEIFDIKHLKSCIKEYESVDRINYDPTNSKISISRNPIHFINTNKGVTLDKTKNNETNEDFIDSITETLVSCGYIVNDNNIVYNTIFPDILDSDNGEIWSGNIKYKEAGNKEFTDKYLKENYTSTNNISSTDDFRIRLMGKASYFCEIYGKNIFPAIKDAIWLKDGEIQKNNIVKVPMSDYQLIEYAEMRNIERKREKMSKFNSNNNNSINKISNLFKIFSRQRCLFVFPPNIQRPKPKKEKKFFEIEVNKYNEQEAVSDEQEAVSDEPEAVSDEPEEVSDEPEEVSDEVETTLIEEKTYRELINDAIEALIDENLKEGSTPQSLSNLSPRYVKMLNIISKCPGKCFCYSQFRSVEGIEIFRRVLESNGYKNKDYDKDIVVGDRCMVLLPAKTIEEEEFNGDDYLYISSICTSINDNGEYIFNNLSTDVEKQSSLIKDDFDDEITELLIVEIDELSTYTFDEVSHARYALWTGTEDETVRADTLKRYNNRANNLYGQQICILLATASGAEGINLWNTRQVHVMEPYWNRIRVEQVIGRARRAHSHRKMPLAQQNVRAYEYMSTFTEKQISGTWGDELPDSVYTDNLNVIETDKPTENVIKQIRGPISESIRKDDRLTSDEYLYSVAQKKAKINEDFLTLIKESAIDCVYNSENNRKACPKDNTLQCLNTDSIVNEYAYEIDNSIILEDNEDMELIERTELVMTAFPVSVGNSTKKTKIYVLVEHTDITKPISKPIPIYDYYIFHGINFNEDIEPHKKIIIGTLYPPKEDSTNNRILLKNTLFPDTIILWKFIEDAKILVEEVPEQFIDKWREQIRNNTEEIVNKWKCPVCDSEHDDDLPCSQCMEDELGEYTREDYMEELRADYSRI